MKASKRMIRWFCATVLFSLNGLAPDAAAATERLSLALPGVPPVFGGVVAMVAKEAGLFKKYDVEVEVKTFDSGAAAAQAVVAGNLDMSLSPTPVVVRMISNANVNLVAIYGLEHPDWLLASADPKLNQCRDLKGAPVGADSVGGSRAGGPAQVLRPWRVRVERGGVVC